MRKALRLSALSAVMVLAGLAARAQGPAPDQSGKSPQLQGGLSGLAAKPSRRAPPKELTPRPAGRVDYWVELSAKYRELDETARFLVADGSQGNHVAGGEKAYPIKHSQGIGVEFKKWGFIVNILPIEDPADPQKVAVQLQVEISGPVKSAISSSSDIPDIATWQCQSSFSVVKGRKTVIVEAPAHVELSIEEAGK